MKGAKREKADRGMQASELPKGTSVMVQTELAQDHTMSLSKKQSSSLKMS